MKLNVIQKVRVSEEDKKEGDPKASIEIEVQELSKVSTVLMIEKSKVWKGERYVDGAEQNSLSFEITAME